VLTTVIIILEYKSSQVVLALMHDVFHVELGQGQRASTTHTHTHTTCY
jgi:hypothetical protein